MYEEPDHSKVFEDFKKAIADCCSEDLDCMPYWFRRCKQVIEDASVLSRFSFLRWPSFAEISPAEGLETIYAHCYHILRKAPEWGKKWSMLTRETKLGCPQDFSLDLGTSPILVQHAFHLLQYQTMVGVPFIDCHAIFEFGGGYGSFCRLTRAAGFQGVHMIYDLPQFSEVQRLYLSCSGIPEVKLEDLTNGGSRSGFCLITAGNLEKALRYCERWRSNLGFVATWSLSEAPFATRELLFPRLHDLFSKYLITYVDEWSGMDNACYFTRYRRESRNVCWRQADIMGSNYLVG
jgi:hypothetical protein